jgi:hypothetical protein
MHADTKQHGKNKLKHYLIDMINLPSLLNDVSINHLTL